MKTVIVKDKKPIIAETPYPLLKSGEIIIKVDYAGMNRADLMQRDGIYPSPIGWPDIMGLEVSGEVYELSEEAKKNSSFHIGDKVCALLGGGGYSEFVSVPYELVLSLPKGINTRIGAAIPEVYCTAYLNLFVEGKLQKGETVYVTAGASGVGIAVTQLAKAYGAKVITSVRSEEKKQAIKKFGADIIINLKNESLFDVFEQNSVDLVIDSVGGNDAGKLFSMLNRGGRWICIATMGGDTSVFDMRIAYKKALRLIGSTLRARTNEVKHDILSHLSDEFFHLFADGTITPEIYKVFDIEQVEEAQEEMRNNKNIGKILLHVNHKN